MISRHCSASQTARHTSLIQWYDKTYTQSGAISREKASPSSVLLLQTWPRTLVHPSACVYPVNSRLNDFAKLDKWRLVGGCKMSRSSFNLQLISCSLRDVLTANIGLAKINKEYCRHRHEADRYCTEWDVSLPLCNWKNGFKNLGHLQEMCQIICLKIQTIQPILPSREASVSRQKLTPEIHLGKSVYPKKHTFFM